jgi:DNA recombination protein RmuC
MLYFVIGFLIGAVLAAALTLVISRSKNAGAAEQMKQAFQALAAEALDVNSRRLTEASAAQLDGKKELIDQSVKAIAERLEAIRKELNSIESKRGEEFGRLSSSVGSLSTTAENLHKMLASTQRRGAWGERMAEDVLRLAGLQEGVNYRKQATMENDPSRPDFTFLLPNDLMANMDVKFPLEKYKAYVDAADAPARAASLKELITAVKGHIRAVAGRGYIDPPHTVPYVLVFLPSEQIFSLVMETAADLLDDALRQRVVLCSPLTLYAMLSMMRQSAENYNVMQTAGEIVKHLNTFLDQYQKFRECMDAMGKKLSDAQNEYEKLVGTRSNMLERPLAKIEELRQSRSLPEAQGK